MLPPTTTHQHPPPPSTSKVYAPPPKYIQVERCFTRKILNFFCSELRNEIAMKFFLYMALSVNFTQEMVSVNQLLCETSLLLKKDRCLSAENILFLKFDEIIEIIELIRLIIIILIK